VGRHPPGRPVHRASVRVLAIDQPKGPTMTLYVFRHHFDTEDELGRTHRAED
jgi:hypothetical protein